MSKNALDSVIKVVSPAWAAKREFNRLRADQYARARQVVARYEGASKSTRMSGWQTVSSGSAVAETQSGLVELRERARDLARNTWVGRRAVDVLTQNIIGTGIRPSIDGDSAAERLIKAWARTNMADTDGLHSFYGLQVVAVASMIESGEALIVKSREKAGPGRIPVSIRVLEGDYLDHNLNERLKGGGRIIQGVEFDRRGRRVAYHLFDEHPGDIYGSSFKRETRRFEARDVVHLFRTLRPGQVRGVSAFAPVMVRLKDWDNYEDAQLMRQQIAACFTAFVRTQGSGPLGDLSPERALGDTDLATHVKPGMIQLLQPGEDVTFGSPPEAAGYRDYADVMLHSVAAGLGISYEALVGDLSKTNFSSARMGWLEFQRNIDVIRSMTLEPLLFSKVADWLTEGLELMGLSLDGRIKWTPPRRQMIDPSKETDAILSGIRAGITSRSSEIRALGRDPEEVYAEIAKDNAIVDELELIFDSDPRRQNKNGTPRGDTPEVNIDLEVENAA